MPPTTYVALEGVTKAHGVRTILDGVTVGVVEGARVGVVGRNGSGKSTLVHLLGGSEAPDAGRVVRLGGLTTGVLDQQDRLPDDATVRHLVLGDRAEHEWAGDARVRDVVTGLLGDLEAGAYQHGFDTPAQAMSGGERRRVALARLLVDDPDLLVLDEPTNHLDLEAVAWLATHLAARRGSLVAVTHDRWFLDAVATDTWEIARGGVHRYEGGYAAYVLARAERERRESADEARRANLVRKELAWLRRGPPARTSKPAFRIEAANALIAAEPPARDRMELERLATSRLGRQVVDLEGVTLAPSPRGPEVLRSQTFRLGPGDRVGLLGPNGAGKSTLLHLLAGEVVDVRAGSVRTGRTVVPALLSQSLAGMDVGGTVLSSTQELRTEFEAGGGRTLTARSVLESFGFGGERMHTRVAALSGGERRRLQLLRLLVGAPNLLLLDEPTNDLDVETLTVVEDLLDSWPGTLVVVSHDRYFLERTTDTQYALLGDGAVRHLPGGVDEYLRRRRQVPSTSSVPPAAPASAAATTELTGGEIRAARKELASLERRTDKAVARIEQLHARLAANATDHETVQTLSEELRVAEAERAELEQRWLELAASLE